MKMAFVADLHASATPSAAGARRGEWAVLLLQRVLHRLCRFVNPDLVVLLGDVADDGRTPDTAARYQEIRAVLDAARLPYLVIPGNHDAPPEVFYRHFPQVPDRFEVGSLRILPFLDEQTEGYHARRHPSDLARSATASESWNGCTIAIQHVPLFPPGTADCPYHYLNATEAIAALQRGGVSLVLSGHFHPGFEAVRSHGMTFVGVPALCEAPFSFLEVTVGERDTAPTIRRHALQIPRELGLTESHVHTEFAYCASGISIAQALEVGRLMGVDFMAFAEHSGQLYFDADTFWSARFMARGIDGQEGRQPRADAYFSALAAAGVPRNGIGIEADVDFRGRLVITPQDRERVGFLLGSVHWIPDSIHPTPYDESAWAEAHRRAWMAAMESGVDVLAHPFRIYNRRGIRPPPDLCAWLARHLAERGIAAELNFHTQEPPRDFVLACLETGTPLSLGTDSHDLIEVGEFWPHLELLTSLGWSRRDVADRVWRPPSGFSSP